MLGSAGYQIDDGPTAGGFSGGCPGVHRAIRLCQDDKEFARWAVGLRLFGTFELMDGERC